MRGYFLSTSLQKQDVWQMKQRIPTELQRHLKKKLFNLLSYYQPEWGKLAFLKKEEEKNNQMLLLTQELYRICDDKDAIYKVLSVFRFRERKRGSEVCEAVKAARTAGERAQQGRESGGEEQRELHAAAAPNSFLPFCESVES